MAGKLSEQLDSLKKKSSKMAEIGRDAAQKAREKAGETARKAREKAEIAADIARARAGEAATRAKTVATEKAHVGAETVSRLTDHVNREKLTQTAESVLDELRNVVMSQTISEIAEVRDANDELRRKLEDMQRIYDKKIADLQAELAERKSTPKAAAKPAPRKPRKPAGE